MSGIRLHLNATHLQYGAMSLPPDKQPKGGWALTIAETGGTVRAEDFGKFVAEINAMLAANGFVVLTPEEILERTQRAGN